MEIRNKVWKELKFSDVSVRTVLWYTDRQRRRARWYKLLTFDPVHLGYLEIGERVGNAF